MTYPSDFTLPAEFLEQLAAQGLEGLPELIRLVINEARSIWASHLTNVQPNGGDMAMATSPRPC